MEIWAVSLVFPVRDVLIHDYMGVDLLTVWKVVQERLPEIKPLVEDLVSEKRIK